MSELSARLDREQRRLTARKQDALRGSERVTKFAWRPLKSFGGGDRYDFVVSSEPTGTRIAAGTLFAAWLVHDLEEAFTFPATSRLLAARLGTDRVVVSPAQSLFAIALMGVLVGAACVRGARTPGPCRKQPCPSC